MKTVTKLEKARANGANRPHICETRLRASFAMAALLTIIILQSSIINASAATRYVSLTGGHVSPFTNWTDAATNIQDAVDIAADGDTVLVTNGFYAAGGRSVYGVQSNRVVIDKPIVVRSVNGPDVTRIEGGAQTRCVYVGTNAVLEGFWLQFGNTRSVGDRAREQSGGGAWCELSGVISNCWFLQNLAYAEGGGVYGGTVYQSYFYLNAARSDGGGASESRLVDCAFRQNTATYYGGGAYRCEVLGGGVSNNTAQSGGGLAYCENVSNCVLRANTANGGSGGGACASTLVNCEISGNQALSGEGGGAASCDLIGCLIAGNLARYGGGVARGTVLGSRLINNRAYSDGGGAYYMDWVLQCEIVSNRASYGGGVARGSVSNCWVAGNRADTQGGGVLEAKVANSFLFGNTSSEGGGASDTDLRNCTVVGNTARYFGGGTSGGSATNCIVYYNQAADRMSPNWQWGDIAFTCTDPLPPGTGNFTNAPLLTDWMHLAADSPCLGTGRPGSGVGVDMEGEPWRNPPSVGCDEPYETATGALEVAIIAPYTNAALGFAVSFRAAVSGHALSNRWSVGGTTLVNAVEFRHAFSEAGVWPVTLTVFNSDFPAGVTATCRVQVGEQVIHYANPASASPVAPFTNWASAAAVLQDAVGAAWQAGALVLATDGVYAVGGVPVDGLPTNRVALTNAVELRSVNGPGHTFIVGAGPWGNAAVRCAHVGPDARLVGFTLTNGCTRNAGDGNGAQSGGGAWCAFGGALSNCVLWGNQAYFGGGGAAFGLLEGCRAEGNYSRTDGGGFYHSAVVGGVLTGNVCRRNGGGAYECSLSYVEVAANAATSSSSYGGGIYGGTLNRGLLQGNRASYGGGTCASTLANALVVSNWASWGGGTYSVEGRNCTIVGNIGTNRGGGDYASILYNSIAYGNTSPNGSNWLSTTFRYSCTLPTPSGAGNIGTDPLFADPLGGDYRLQSNSPCVNAGTNFPGMGLEVDLDGKPRVIGGHVDMGAYEYGEPTAFQLWLQGYGLATDGSADFEDPDKDRQNNWAEFRSRTNPTDPWSVFRLVGVRYATVGSNAGPVITWSSEAGCTYYLDRSGSLLTNDWPLLLDSIPATPPLNVHTDTTAVGNGPWFYRAGLDD